MTKEDPCANQQGGSPAEASFTVLVTPQSGGQRTPLQRQVLFLASCSQAKKNPHNEILLQQPNILLFTTFSRTRDRVILVPLGETRETRCWP